MSKALKIVALTALVVGDGSADQSRGSNPLSTSSSAAQSDTVRVIGPTWATGANGLGGYMGTRPSVGLNPTTPQ